MRIVEAAPVPLIEIGIGKVASFALVTMEPATMRYVCSVVVVSLPLIAWILYREHPINRIERISILPLVPAAGALPCASAAQAANVS